jgi:hypothetical protein
VVHVASRQSEKEHETRRKTSRQTKNVALVYSVTAVLPLRAKNIIATCSCHCGMRLRKPAFALEIYYILSTTLEEESSRRRKKGVGRSDRLSGWLVG